MVEELLRSGMAVESEGAICLFLEGFDAPMIVRKRDGAFLYATTDIATIQYRVEHFHPDVILYVVDHRQSEHFAKLFAAARAIGYDQLELHHISFGTVLGSDGKPLRRAAARSSAWKRCSTKQSSEPTKPSAIPSDCKRLAWK